MSKRRNLVAEVMSELCLYGGLVATRMEVYEDLRSLRGENGEKLDYLGLDRLTWTPEAITEEEADFLRSAGLTLKAIREQEAVGAAQP